MKIRIEVGNVNAEISLAWGLTAVAIYLGMVILGLYGLLTLSVPVWIGLAAWTLLAILAGFAMTEAGMKWAHWFSLWDRRRLDEIERLKGLVRKTDNRDIAELRGELEEARPLIEQQSATIRRLEHKVEYWRTVALKMPYEELTTFRAERERHGDAGQGLVEYALILLLVAMVLLALVYAPGIWASQVYSGISSGIEVQP